MQEAGAEFVKLLKVDRLKRDPLTFSFVANEKERANLASRLDILALDSLEVSGEVARKSESSLLELSGTVKAEAVQACVISLKPVPQKIDVAFSVCYTFSKEDSVLDDTDYVVGKDEDDLPEYVEEGKIDAVLAVLEQIALALDPYPRAEGAEISDGAKEFLQQSEEKAEGETEEVYKPFANLKDMLNKK